MLKTNNFFSEFLSFAFYIRINIDNWLSNNHEKDLFMRRKNVNWTNSIILIEKYRDRKIIALL